MTDQEINEGVAKGLGNLPCSDAYSQLTNKDGSHICAYCGAKVSLEDPEHIQQRDYCHNIKAAWEIVEFLQKTNSLEIIPRRDGKTMVIIETDKYPYKAKGIGSVSDTAPMAICLAFLKLESK